MHIFLDEKIENSEECEGDDMEEYFEELEVHGDRYV